MVPTPTTIHVTVQTRIPEFILLQIKEYRVGVNQTWNDLLNERGYPSLEASKFCIKGNLLGTPVFSMDDKIQHLVALYRRSVREYKVTLAKITSAVAVKLKSKRRASKKTLHSVRQPQPQPVGRQNGRVRILPLAGTSSRVNNIPQGTFPEGALPFPVEEIAEQLDNNYPGNGYANDDNESMASQDSQDEREDIKAKVLNNFVKGVSNGELHEIRDQFASLRPRGKILRAAKYFPLGILFFDVIFGAEM